MTGVCDWSLLSQISCELVIYRNFVNKQSVKEEVIQISEITTSATENLLRKTFKGDYKLEFKWYKKLVNDKSIAVKVLLGCFEESMYWN